MDLLPIVSAVIVALGVVVAFLQWLTARQKAALELKDRQLKLYQTVKNCVHQFSINSQRFGGELEKQFLKVEDEARFLDDNLHNYLEALRQEMLIVHDIDKHIARLQEQGKTSSPTELAKLGAKRDQAMNLINRFYAVGQSKFTSSRPRSWLRKLVKRNRPIP
jgi:hypothetical protein